MNVPAVNPAATSHLVNMAAAGNARLLANLSPQEQTKAVSGQFEAIMVRQLLQQSIGGMMGGESGGPTGNVYGYLLTDVLANKLTEGGGFGLANLFYQQLVRDPDGATTETGRESQ